MSQRRLKIYVALMSLAALLCLATTEWSVIGELPLDSGLALVGLIGIALLSESLAIKVMVAGGNSGNNSSITFLPLLASVQLFGPPAGILLAVSTLSFAEFVVRRNSPFRAVFNVSQCVVATTLAGQAFVLARGQPLETADPTIISQLWPFLSFGLLFLALNHAAVSLAITFSQGLPFRRVWQQALDHTGGSLSDLLISPLALAVAFLYVQFGIAGIVIVLFPMLFIRHSYLTTSRLRQSNSDLLTALVKAIEIRDPYTSGHSLRVAELAKGIAEELGLGRVAVDHVSSAALLHDIGKIEAIYTEILRKPDALTVEERAIIESHVTRGEQLLRDLSSVPEEVVEIVRHHHEREDGRGYPDGLLGDEIPMGSKIIVVCDAVDAMLSDRPYREALPLSVVMKQLEEHAGRQFDHRVVRALVQSDILTDFAETMRLVREAKVGTPGDHLARVPSMHRPPARSTGSAAHPYH